MRNRSSFAFSLLLLGGCAAASRQVTLHSSVTANPGGDLWVIAGTEQGLPLAPESAQRLLDAWSSEVTANCKGSYTGGPSLQVTSFAAPGQPFADPFAAGTVVKFTAALGNAHCPVMFVATP